MGKPLNEQIVAAAIDDLAEYPQGVASGTLILDHLPARLTSLDLSNSAVHQVLLRYSRQPESVIYQPRRGYFRHVKFRDAPEYLPFDVDAPSTGGNVREEAFYKPFAEWLVVNLEECTKAIPVGGNRLGDKWGTPDVIGVRKPSVGDIIPAPVEIVSAEIKVSPEGLITAFGQACSYKLFSHKSYIVVPKTASPEDVGRLEALCLVVGIGLILLDPASPANPAFEIRSRAARHEPDTFYVNEKLKRVGRELLD